MGVDPKNCTRECCSWVFAELSSEEFCELTELMRFGKFEKGEVIFQEGTSSSGLYVVCKGRVKVLQQSQVNVKKQLLKLIGPGELLGECTLFDDQGLYTSLAQTISESELSFIEKDSFIRCIKRKPQICIKLIEKLSRELKAFQSKLIETSYQNIEARLSRLILLMADKFGVKKDSGIDVNLQLSRSELAEMAGVTTETVIRTLSKLREGDLITLDGANVFIKDKKSLQKLTKPLPVILTENIL